MGKAYGVVHLSCRLLAEIVRLKVFCGMMCFMKIHF
eukprot:COSAG01_NODE_2156_length_8253_cov_15.131280_3_plen_36_part_00